MPSGVGTCTVPGPLPVLGALGAAFGLRRRRAGVLRRDGRMDTMLVRVEARPESFGVADGAGLAEAVKQRIGVTAAVEVVAPGGIERSLGKARRVVDRRGG